MAQHMEDRAFEVLDEMNGRGVYPRADTFNSILTGLSKVSGLAFASSNLELDASST